MSDYWFHENEEYYRFLKSRWIKKIKPKDTLNKCVSCGGPAKDDFCEFCLKEE